MGGGRLPAAADSDVWVDLGDAREDHALTQLAEVQVDRLADVDVVC